MADNFRIPVARFVAGLKGSRDEVWTKLITLQFAQQAKTASEWQEVLTALKDS